MLKLQILIKVYRYYIYIYIYGHLKRHNSLIRDFLDFGDPTTISFKEYFESEDM